MEVVGSINGKELFTEEQKEVLRLEAWKYQFKRLSKFTSESTKPWKQQTGIGSRAVRTVSLLTRTDNTCVVRNSPIICRSNVILVIAVVDHDIPLKDHFLDPIGDQRELLVGIRKGSAFGPVCRKLILQRLPQGRPVLGASEHAT